MNVRTSRGWSQRSPSPTGVPEIWLATIRTRLWWNSSPRRTLAAPPW